MSDFYYLGIDRFGQKISGIFNTASEGELRMILRGQGVRPTRVTRAGTLTAQLFRVMNKNLKCISTTALNRLTSQFWALVELKVPTTRAIEILLNQNTGSRLGVLIKEVKEKMSRGLCLWEVLRLYPQSFPLYYVRLIKIGEESGNLNHVLKNISSYLKSILRLKKEERSIHYFLIGIILFFLSTSAIFAYYRGYSLLSIVAVLFFGTYFWVRYKNSQEGREFLDPLFFRIPILGKVYKKFEVMLFSETLSVLLSSGINLVEALEICRQTSRNLMFKELIAKLKNEVESGRSLTEGLSRVQMFPDLAQMVYFGEQDGNLSQALGRIVVFLGPSLGESK